MRIFAICPRVKKQSGCIVVTTSWAAKLLFVGTFRRKLVIDPLNKVMSISSRYFWFFHRQKTVPFSNIRAVTYGYEDISPGSVISITHNSIDWFTVGLRFKDDTEIRLFNFIGEGTFNNNGPFPDWLYWDDFTFDISGSQGKESRLFVDVLSNIIDVEVVPPRNY